MLVEISGVCPSCGNCEHHGHSKDNRVISYLCSRCWTAYVRQNDALVAVSDMEYRQNQTLDGLKQITRILREARKELK